MQGLLDDVLHNALITCDGQNELLASTELKADYTKRVHDILRGKDDDKKEELIDQMFTSRRPERIVRDSLEVIDVFEFGRLASKTQEYMNQ